jgi:hypothetical protein
MKKLLFTILLFTFTFSISFGQSWAWGQDGIVKGTLPFIYGEGEGVTQDTKNDVLLTGYFSDSLQFGPYLLISPRSTNITNVFLAKYNKNGVVKWARQSTNSNYNLQSVSVAADLNDNVFVMGNFIGTIYFGTLNVTSSTGDTYLVKYDSTGNPLWIRQSLGGTQPVANGMATDKWGNIYITGLFRDSVVFGSYILRSPAYQLFLVKYSPNGNVLWAKQSSYACPDCSGVSNAVATDLSGNVFITGTADSIAIDTIKPKRGPVYIAKYDSGGNALWVSTANIPRDTAGDVAIPTAITTDIAGNAIIGGSFNYLLIFGNDTLTGPSPQPFLNLADIFITKYTPGGNVDWITIGREIGFSMENWSTYTLATDYNKNVYVTASSYPQGSEIQFGNDTLKCSGSAPEPTLLARFDSTGKLTCGNIYPFAGDDWVGITVDPSGNSIYLGGDLLEQTIFGTDTVPGSSNGENPFVAKWISCSNIETGENSVGANKSVKVFPNPNNGIFTIQTLGTQNFVPATVEIYNVLGGKVYSQFNIQNSTINIDLTGRPGGIYLYRILSQSGTLVGSGKFIIE